MTTVLEEKDGLRELKHEFCEAVDEPNPPRVVDLFTDDASFNVPSYGEGEGRDDVRAFAEGLTDLDHRVRSHNIFNDVITVADDVARGRWYYIVVYEHTDGSVELGQGRFQDTFRKENGEWKIASFTATRRVTTTV